MSEEIAGYWTSEEGVTLRLEDLAHDFTWRTYNGALRMTYEEGGFKRLRWITTIQTPIGKHRKGSTCPICFSRNGKEYKVGQFMPRIPVHPSCNCFWDIFIEVA